MAQGKAFSGCSNSALTIEGYIVGQCPASSTTSVVASGAWRWNARRPAALIQGSRIPQSGNRGLQLSKPLIEGLALGMSNLVRKTPCPWIEGGLANRFHQLVVALV